MSPVGPRYPVDLLLEGQRCVVVGGGPVAARKAAGLRSAGATVHVVARQVSASVRALDVTWDERDYRRGDLDGARVAITATGDPEVDGAVFADGEATGVLVNSADDPERCRFTLPSVLRRGDLQVAVSTGGRSPALAAWLRRELEGVVGSEHEVLLGVLAEERDRLRTDGVATEGLDWQGALESGMLELIRQGRTTEAKERLRACLSSSSD